MAFRLPRSLPPHQHEGGEDGARRNRLLILINGAKNTSAMKLMINAVSRMA